MALADIANIAEIIGVILVVLTLIFLTLQIRQNSLALKATTTQNIMSGETAITTVLVNNAEIWEKILSGEPLAPGTETRKAIVIFNLYMIDTESRYLQFKIGFLDSETWKSRLRSLPGITRLEVFKIWRQSLGGQAHTGDFLKLLDELASD